MKVKELIAELQELNPESHIAISVDSEGNYIRSIHGVFDIGIAEGEVLAKEVDITDEVYEDDSRIAEFFIDWDSLDYENEDGSGSWEGYEFDKNECFKPESYEKFKKDRGFQTVYALFPHV